MPSLSTYSESSFIKLILLGESKTGKTGALASLARAGYSLNILDFDAGLDYLAAELADDSAALSRVHYQTFRDRTKLTTTGDLIIDGRAKAFADAFKVISGEKPLEEDGPLLKDSGPSSVVVVDSLWAAGLAAFHEHYKMAPSKDPRQTYGGAQTMLRGMLSNLTDDEFQAHVIVITHMTLMELDTGVTKGLPAAIGKALSPDIPKYFNRMLVAEIKGAGSTSRRVISTVPTSLISATSGMVKGKIGAELPIETGLADFFAAIRGPLK